MPSKKISPDLARAHRRRLRIEDEIVNVSDSDGGVPGAPVDAAYVVLEFHNILTQERKLTPDGGITLVDEGPNARVLIASGITLKDEGNTVGTPGRITSLDIVGANATASAVGANGTITISGGSGTIPYDVGCTWNGKPPASTVLVRVPLPRTVDFPTSLAASKGVVDTAATAQTDFDIRKNGTSFGTMRFAASATVATFISSAGASFAAGDVLKVVAPASPDSTLAGLGFCLAGSLP